MSNIPSTGNVSCLDVSTLNNPVYQQTVEPCQLAANTTFCWPPNGTRICVPLSKQVEFFWPPDYYDPDARIAVEYDLDDWFVPLHDNTGKKAQAFTQFMYESKADSIPGVEDEKSMQMYLQERIFNDEWEEKDPFNLKTYDGPEVILVKTSEWPSTTRSPGSESTSYSSYDDNDDDDDDPRRFNTGQIVGLVMGMLGVVFFIVLWCCCSRCGYSCCRGTRNLKWSTRNYERPLNANGLREATRPIPETREQRDTVRMAGDPVVPSSPVSPPAAVYSPVFTGNTINVGGGDGRWHGDGITAQNDGTTTTPTDDAGMSAMRRARDFNMERNRRRRAGEEPLPKYEEDPPPVYTP